MPTDFFGSDENQQSSVIKNTFYFKVKTAFVKSKISDSLMPFWIPIVILLRMTALLNGRLGLK